MTKRLNARLDDDLAEKLDLLQRRTRKNVTEIVRESIELYYRHTKEATDGARHLLEASGFVGCADAEVDLSARYKDLLADLAAAKTARR